MARKLRLKRTISGITAAVMMIAAVPTTPAYAESGATSYSFDGYDVEYSVKNEWSDGKTIEVKITNTGDEPILNWAFKYDAEGKVNDLWNASVYSADNTSYIIKNDGWNYEIAPAASVFVPSASFPAPSERAASSPAIWPPPTSTDFSPAGTASARAHRIWAGGRIPSSA